MATDAGWAPLGHFPEISAVIDAKTLEAAGFQEDGDADPLFGTAWRKFLNRHRKDEAERLPRHGLLIFSLVRKVATLAVYASSEGKPSVTARCQFDSEGDTISTAVLRLCETIGDAQRETAALWSHGG